MSSNVPCDAATVARWRRWIRIAVLGRIVVLLLGLYLFLAYLVMPLDWMQYVHRHPAIDNVPGITRTKLGIPGDPVNVGLISSESDLQLAMRAANWSPADPVTLEISLRIATDAVFRRSYDDAPISSLYLWGRKQDLAFEQPVGGDPRRRHHVRFWRSAELDAAGKPMWFGAVTFDTKVGLSHTTGEITHHISPDVDGERDKLINDLRQALQLTSTYWVDGFHTLLQGTNGGGDPYHTDGRLEVGVVTVSPR
jgi:hypothetical protein